MTLLAVVGSCAAQLQAAGLAFGHGTSNAQDEAAWLVLWSLGLPLDTPLDPDASEANRLLTPAESGRIATLLEARIHTRKPLAYLTREAWLQGFAFYVDERAIVPRSLIAELLVNGAVDYWLKDTTHALLDLCTGNGSLAIIAALVFPEVLVDAADLSTDALAVARINVDRHQLRDRVRLVESDGLAALDGCYDLILCNPPYVNAQSMAALPAEYRSEPALALDGNVSGGTDGMDFIRALLRDVSRCMTPDAVLLLEIGNERAHFEAAFPALEVVWLDTSAGEDQVLLITRNALSP